VRFAAAYDAYVSSTAVTSAGAAGCPAGGTAALGASLEPDHCPVAATAAPVRVRTEATLSTTLRVATDRLEGDDLVG
jgi:hypothetical protein